MNDADRILEAMKSNQDAITGRFDAIDTRFSRLPCQDHEQRLRATEINGAKSGEKLGLLWKVLLGVGAVVGLPVLGAIVHGVLK